ncbi:MAG: hypothetical protein N2053_05950 [Chitinispirillaceae bacterium]|nr:hypothetical protein [Chitinispirillaceae bacterium]
MKTKFQEKGVTAVEVVIYISLFVLVSLFIARQFRSVTQNYASSKRVTRQMTETRDILSLMVRELRNMGLKTYLQQSGSTYTKMIAQKTFITDATDSSSFVHTQGTPGDMIKFYKAVLNSSGGLSSVDSIVYYLNGTKLMRNHNNNITEVADNVYALQFEYGILGTSVSTILNQNPITPGNWTLTNSSGTAPTKSGSTELILTFKAAATGYLKYNSTVNVSSTQKVSATIIGSSSGGFPDNLDSLRLSIKSGSTIRGSDIFRIYKKDVKLVFPVQKVSGGDVYLEYWTRGKGKLTIKSIVVKGEGDSSLVWTFNPATNQKRYVKAIKIYLLTRSKDKTSTKVSTPITVGEINVSRSGEYTWRLMTEIVPVPSNGVF